METASQLPKKVGLSPTYQILFAISLGHLLNDSMQAVVPAIFPILEQKMNLSYTQIGWIAFVLNMTSSLLQPVLGTYSDKKPSPYLLPLGMFFSLVGMLTLAFAPNFVTILLAALFIGFGSAIFHPEGSRVAYMAAGSRRGLAQSIYQVGGNTGNALAPLFTILIFVPLGQIGASVFSITAAIGVMVLFYVSTWYKKQLTTRSTAKKTNVPPAPITNKIKMVLFLIVLIMFARSWYSAGIGNYYQFYLINHYGLSIKDSQYYVFAFMIAGVIGTFLGGPLADRFGKRTVIIFSLLGVAPLAIFLPYVPLSFAFILISIIGFINFSSFAVIVVYAQELVPGRIGMVSGLTVGLAFGMGAIGSVALGGLADIFSISFLMTFCSFLPFLGLLSLLLPKK
ncbi:MAG: MFS transporter [Bacillaceae bacterium]